MRFLCFKVAVILKWMDGWTNERTNERMNKQTFQVSEYMYWASLIVKSVKEYSNKQQ